MNQCDGGTNKHALGKRKMGASGSGAAPPRVPLSKTAHENAIANLWWVNNMINNLRLIESRPDVVVEKTKLTAF